MTWPTLFVLSNSQIDVNRAMGDIMGTKLSDIPGTLTTSSISDITSFAAVPFNASNFTASGSMTWTVTSSEVTTLAYSLMGKRMTVLFELASTTVGGVVSPNLQIAIPLGKVAYSTTRNMMLYNDNGGADTLGYVIATAGSSVLQLRKLASANWTLATTNTSVFGQLTLRVR